MDIGNNTNDNQFFSRQWTMGPCYGPTLFTNYSNTISGDYTPNEIHYDRCCLPSGKYTLTCINRKSTYGWGNVTFKIDGRKYCDDFIGFKAMETVLVQGKDKKSKNINKFIYFH